MLSSYFDTLQRFHDHCTIISFYLNSSMVEFPAETPEQLIASSRAKGLSSSLVTSTAAVRVLTEFVLKVTAVRIIHRNSLSLPLS